MEKGKRYEQLLIILPILTTASQVLEGRTVSGFKKRRVTAKAKLTDINLTLWY